MVTARWVSSTGYTTNGPKRNIAFVVN